MRRWNLSHYAIISCVIAALLAGCGASQQPIGAPGAMPQTTSLTSRYKKHSRTFDYTGDEQTFKVPSGVKWITVIALGAAGGGANDGKGGRVRATIPVMPGQRVIIFVGGQGSQGKGGFNGGGGAKRKSDAYGGGGASDVRQGGKGLANRVLVVGGGGGQGGGVGGTQSEGGAGGSGGAGSDGFGLPGMTGSLGSGGAGGPGCTSKFGRRCNSGGGGGGGYYGGGGGGAGAADYGFGGGGGGGGSSYVESNAIKFHFWRGWRKATGNGVIVFSW